MQKINFYCNFCGVKLPQGLEICNKCLATHEDMNKSKKQYHQSNYGKVQSGPGINIGNFRYTPEIEQRLKTYIIVGVLIVFFGIFINVIFGNILINIAYWSIVCVIGIILFYFQFKKLFPNLFKQQDYKKPPIIKV